MTSPGKVAVVTGGGRGIGRAVAVRLARDGIWVVVNHPPGDREREAAEEAFRVITDDGGTAMTLEADVSRRDDVVALFGTVLATWGGVDILVNNAGICPFETWWDMSEELFQEVWEVNLRGAFLCSHEASRIMREQGRGGRIISISSISALVGGSLQTHYTPTKAGIRSLMQSLAIVLGPHGITCNSILPGTILTDINRSVYEDPDRLAADAARVPVGRLGRPEDIAGAVAFLASEEAAYINGADLLIDGGRFVNLQ